jgi:Dolichyl-phosphate-mannose-protein mannosyltransferase
MIQIIRIPFFLKNKSRIGLFLICLFYLINGIHYIRTQSITTDESGFYNYAKRLIRGYPERMDPAIDNSKTPVIVLNLIPRIAEQLNDPEKHKSDWGAEDIKHGRYISLIISLLVILVVYKWSKELYGEGAGLFSAFLIALNPNIIALAGLVTTDAYSVLFLLLPFYFLWKTITGRSFLYFILFSLATAFAQLTKPSLFHLYVLLPITLLIYVFAYRPAIRIAGILRCLAIFLVIQWFIINLGYYFYGTNKLLGNYHFTSQLFQSVQNLLPAGLPVPLPEPFLEGLDLSKYYDQLGGGYPYSSFGKITILGRSSVGGSFWYYYLISIIFKTPITYFILMAWVVFFRFRKRSSQGIGRHILFLIMPVFYFFFMLSFFYKTQLGIRHIIFLYPFICILCSSVIPYADTNAKKRTIGFLSLYLMISVLYYWGNYFPYTNELVPDKTFAYKIVGAANLEFHQSTDKAMDYLKEHPNVKPAGGTPGTGDFLIRLDNYMGIWGTHTYDWISSINPYGQVAFDYLLVHVDSAGLKK